MDKFTDKFTLRHKYKLYYACIRLTNLTKTRQDSLNQVCTYNY